MSPAVVLGVAVGVWLMVAPAILGYAGAIASDVHRIAGPVATSLGVVAAWDTTRAVRWPNAAIGAGVVAAVPVLGPDGFAALASITAGLVLMAATPFARRPKQRLGGGWRSLWDHASEENAMTKRKVVVVTGASAGVGRAIARAFADEGADVGLLARNRDGLEAAAKEVEAAGGRACVVPVDMADANAVEAAAEAVERELGTIDVWVNNAMTSVFATFLDVLPEEFARVTDVTYHGYVHGTRAALKRMLPRDDGVIVQIGSALAYRAIPLQSAYCGAKHAVEGFTESVRCELIYSRSRVRIGTVQLPAVNTPQFDWVLSRLPNRAQPVPPIYQPEPIARSVVAFAKRPRREMWLGWATVRAILANKLVPGLLDRYIGRTGVDAQQTEEPERPDRPSNLWSPVDGDWGAHGRFDARALPDSRAMWFSRHRRALTMAGTAMASIAVAGLVRRR